MSGQNSEWEWLGDNYYVNTTQVREEIAKRELPEAERGKASVLGCACLTAAGPCEEHRHLLEFSRRQNVYIFGDGDGSGLHNQWKEAGER